MHTNTNVRGVQAANCSHGARTLPVPAFDVFRLRCKCRAILVDACLMNLVEAVDGLQAAAVRYGLTEEIGQDRVQAIIADAFRGVQ